MKTNKHLIIKHLIVLLVIGFMLYSDAAFAQGAGGDGIGGIQQANTEVRKYYKPLTDLMYAIGAVLGLIGAIKVYAKWNSGDQDTQKTAVTWFGAMIFLVLVATVVTAFFGVN